MERSSLRKIFSLIFLIISFQTTLSQNVKVEPTFTFLNSTTKTYTVADLKVIDLPVGATPFWYDALTGGNIVPFISPLISGQKYFLETIPTAAIGTRLQTIVYEINPTITADKTNNICIGETVNLLANNLLSNEQFGAENTNELGLNLTKITQFGNSTYYVKKQTMSWENANNLINAIPGASMYIINSTMEEITIYTALNRLGLTNGTIGNDGIAFWLGLKQYPNSSNFNDNSTQSGWYWIDGTPMNYTNWSSGEPNDYRDFPGGTPPFLLFEIGGSNDEDYAQFEFQNRGIKWNDAPNDTSNRNSYPIFEFTATSGLQWFQFNTATNNYVAISGETSGVLSVTASTGIQKYKLEMTSNGTTYSIFYEIIKTEPKVFPIPTNLTTLCATEIDPTTQEEKAYFDTSSFENSLLGGQTNMVVNYSDAKGNTLPSPLPNPYVSGTQNLIATVANSATPTCVIPTIIPLTVIPDITIKLIDIDDLSIANSITIYLKNDRGQNQYSINGSNGPFQNSNFFSPVESGKHEVYVKDINNCGFDSQTIYVMGAPQFFTPNGDGYNDYWNIKGIDNTLNSNAIIYIYDRYGKFIQQLKPLDQGWDGTYSGNQLPASDYWYTVKLEGGREAKGHFSLKR